MQQSSLFDLDSLLPRPLPEQKAFEDEFTDFLSAIPTIIQKSYQLTDNARRQKEPASINVNWFANEMSGNIACQIGKKFPHFIKPVRNTYCLNLNYKYEVYVKKLNKQLKPSYHHSDTSWANINQRTMSKTTKPAPLIYIGYTTNEQNTLIRGYYAVCWQGDNKLWDSDLVSVASRNVKSAKNENENPNLNVEVNLKKKPNRKSK